MEVVLVLSTVVGLGSDLGSRICSLLWAERRVSGARGERKGEHFQLGGREAQAVSQVREQSQRDSAW